MSVVRARIEGLGRLSANLGRLGPAIEKALADQKVPRDGAEREAAALIEAAIANRSEPTAQTPDAPKELIAQNIRCFLLAQTKLRNK